MSGLFAYCYVLLLSTSVTISQQLRLTDRAALGIIFTVFLAVFSAFRYNFGYDYFNYEIIIASQDYSGFEYLHRLLFEWANSVSSYQLYFTATSILIFILYAFLANVIGRRYSFLFALLSFVCLPTGYIESTSIIRQYIAALSFLCLFFYGGRSRLLQLLLLIVGAASHFTFFIVLPLLALKKLFDRNYGMASHLSLLIATQVMVQLFLQVSSFADDPYVQYMASLNASGLGFLLVSSMIYSAITAFYFSQKVKDADLVRVYNCYAFGFYMYIALFQMSVHAARLSFYFLLVQPFVLGFMFYRVGVLSRLAMLAFCNAVFLLYLHVSYVNGVRDYLNHFTLRFY